MNSPAVSRKAKNPLGNHRIWHKVGQVWISFLRYTQAYLPIQRKITPINHIGRSCPLKMDASYCMLSATAVDVSLIIGPISLVESRVGGGVVLLIVLSALVELSLPFPQPAKNPAIATINNFFFIMDSCFALN